MLLQLANGSYTGLKKVLYSLISTPQHPVQSAVCFKTHPVAICRLI